MICEGQKPKNTLAMNDDVYVFDLASTGRGHCPYIVKTLAKKNASWHVF
jgi:hypothetical protein